MWGMSVRKGWHIDFVTLPTFLTKYCIWKKRDLIPALLRSGAVESDNRRKTLIPRAVKKNKLHMSAKTKAWYRNKKQNNPEKRNLWLRTRQFQIQTHGISAPCYITNIATLDVSYIFQMVIRCIMFFYMWSSCRETSLEPQISPGNIYPKTHNQLIADTQNQT
jgi:hypothetical protein